MLICSGTRAEFLLCFEAACVLQQGDKLYRAGSSLQSACVEPSVWWHRLIDNQNKTFYSSGISL